MIYERQSGVPKFECFEYEGKKSDYAVLIPIINEGERIVRELKRAFSAKLYEHADIIICDGGSVDGCTEEARLRALGVNTLLIKKDEGKQGAQLRMGIFFALERGYEGIITIDGNDKDSIENVPDFIEKLRQGYDLVQGSRFVKGGVAINTPKSRYLALKLLHAPIISLTAGFKFTDTTNAYRAYSRKYLTDARVEPLRDIFSGYELLAYLSVRATQIGLRACEIPVTRAYPKNEKTPTKISPLKGNLNLLKILSANAQGAYLPAGERKGSLALAMQFFKFILVGASNTLILLAIYYLTIYLLGAKAYMLAQALGYAAGIVNSFYWNSRHVFNSEKKSGIASFVKMTVSYAVTYVIQAGLLYLFVDVCAISEVWAPIIAIIITTPINFVLNKLFAFK